MSPAKSAAFAAILLLSATAVSAQDQPATPAPAAQPAPASAPAAKNPHDPNTVICKHEEETGSRLGGAKVCHTRAEWQQMASDSAKAVEDAQMSGARANVGNGGH